MKTIIKTAAAMTLGTVALGAAIGAGTANAAADMWVNGMFVSNGSYCKAGYTGCNIKVQVGKLDCRPFVGADVWKCISGQSPTTNDYRNVAIWRESPVYYCTAFGVAHGARIDGTGVISKLNGAKVTVAYHSFSDDKGDYIRCSN